MAYDYDKHTVYIDCYLGTVLTLYIGKDKGILAYHGLMQSCNNIFTFNINANNVAILIILV